MEEIKIFKTDYYALCPYLRMKGLRYLKTEYEENQGKNKAYFYFEDPRGIGKDLEVDFRFSDLKQYKDLLHFFRNEMEKAKKEL